MVRFEQRREIPHLSVCLSGWITYDELIHDAPALEAALGQLREGFVALIDCTTLTGFDPEAVGVMLYLTAFSFRAKPDLILVVNGGREINALLLRQAGLLDTFGCLHLFETCTQAEAFVASLQPH